MMLPSSVRILKKAAAQTQSSGGGGKTGPIFPQQYHGTDSRRLQTRYRIMELYTKRHLSVLIGTVMLSLSSDSKPFRSLCSVPPSVRIDPILESFDSRGHRRTTKRYNMRNGPEGLVKRQNQRKIVWSPPPPSARYVRQT